MLSSWDYYFFSSHKHSQAFRQKSANNKQTNAKFSERQTDWSELKGRQGWLMRYEARRPHQVPRLSAENRKLRLTWATGSIASGVIIDFPSAHTRPTELMSAFCKEGFNYISCTQFISNSLVFVYSGFTVNSIKLIQTWPFIQNKWFVCTVRRSGTRPEGKGAFQRYRRRISQPQVMNKAKPFEPSGSYKCRVFEKLSLKAFTKGSFLFPLWKKKKKSPAVWSVSLSLARSPLTHSVSRHRYPSHK